MESLVGEQLGNYHVLRLIGTGGFAEVYLGEHIHLKTYAALKVLRTRLSSTDIEEFRREAQTIARLEHPHIVRILDFGMKEQTPFLVLNYAPHGTLRTKHPASSILPPLTVSNYVKQVAEALQYAHDTKIVHRDIKPENMLVGQRQEVLLSDFGIALVIQTSNLQNMQNIAGTISYMAPEQINAHPCPASDQYALAIVAYEWLCGKRPFQGSFTEVAAQHHMMPPPPLHTKNPQLALQVEEVIMKALAKDPNARFANISAFAQALEQNCLAPSSMPILLQSNRQQLTPLHIAQTPISANKAHSSAQTLAAPTTTHTIASVHPAIIRVRRITSFIRISFILFLLLSLAFISIRQYENSLQRGSSNTQFINRQQVAANSTATTLAEQKTFPATATALVKQNTFPSTPGKLIFSDPLLNNDQGNDWETYSVATNPYGGGCQFENNGYHVIENQNFVQACSMLNSEAHNFAFEVTMKVIKGNCGGINFRDNKNTTAYHFQVCQDGTYALLRYGSKNIPTLLGGNSPLIKTGAFQSNQVEVIAIGSLLIFYVNKQKIDSTTDTSYSDGYISLRASPYGEPVEVVYNHAQFWTL